MLNALHSALILCINKRQEKEEWNEGKDQFVILDNRMPSVKKMVHPETFSSPKIIH